MAGREAPTLDDAHRAARALRDARVGEVWLYGSVSRGDAGPDSDIDLVAVLEDLEYRQRWRTTRELQELAGRACGHRVEVMVTDRPEWRIQREQVPASFVSAISCDLQLLECSSMIFDDVDWDKDQVMATSNDELALERLRAVLLNLTKIDGGRGPSQHERELAELDDPGDWLMVRGGRLVEMCEAADMAVENAAKSVGVLSEVKAQTLWQHDVDKIIDEFDDEDTDAFRELLAAKPDLVKSPDYVTMWRTCGVYGTPTEGMTVQEIATPAFAAAISTIACDVALHAADAVERRIGDQPDTAEVRRWASRIRRDLAKHDLTTGEPLQAPSRYQPHAAGEISASANPLAPG